MCAGPHGLDCCGFAHFPGYNDEGEIQVPFPDNHQRCHCTELRQGKVSQDGIPAFGVESVLEFGLCLHPSGNRGEAAVLQGMEEKLCVGGAVFDQ